jgi:hypothetical protein
MSSMIVAGEGVGRVDLEISASDLEAAILEGGDRKRHRMDDAAAGCLGVDLISASMDSKLDEMDVPTARTTCSDDEFSTPDTPAPKTKIDQYLADVEKIHVTEHSTGEFDALVAKEIGKRAEVISQVPTKGQQEIEKDLVLLVAHKLI